MMEVSDKDTRLWGMLCHLTALAGIIGIPFGNIIGPLVVWLVKREEIPFVDDQGKASLNFQISMTIYGLIAGILSCLGIGIILLLIVWIVDLVFIIIASIRANEGQPYRYPLAIPFIR